MEPYGLLTHLQEPANCPYHEPDRSSPCPPSKFSKIHFNIIHPPMPGPSKRSPSLRLPHLNPVFTSPFPIRSTCPHISVLPYEAGENKVASSDLWHPYNSRKPFSFTIRPPQPQTKARGLADPRGCLNSVFVSYFSQPPVFSPSLNLI